MHHRIMSEEDKELIALPELQGSEPTLPVLGAAKGPNIVNFIFDTKGMPFCCVLLKNEISNEEALSCLFLKRGNWLVSSSIKLS